MVKKIKLYFKRMCCILLASIFLSQTVISGWTRQYEAYAIAPTTVNALYTLFYAVLASCGVSCGSTSQNASLAGAFEDWLGDVISGKEAVDGIVYGDASDELSGLKGFAAGRNFALKEFPTMVKLMKYFVTKVAPFYTSATSKFKGDSKVDYGKGTGIPYFSSSAMQIDFLNYCKGFGLDLKESNKVSYDRTPFYAVDVNEKKTTMNIYTIDVRYNSMLYPQNDWILMKQNGVISCKKNFGNDIFSGTTQNDFFHVYTFKRDSITSDWKYSSSWNYSTYTISNGWAHARYGYCCPIFETNEELSSYVNNLSRFKGIEGLYGSTDNAFEYPENFQLQVGDTSLSDAITQGIQQALENSSTKSLTSEQVSEIVNQNVIDYSAQIGAINDKVSDLNSAQVVSNSWLSKIYSKICEIASSVDGSSALQLDDVTDQFKVVTGGGNKDPDNDDNDPKIWGMGTFTVVSFLQPLLEFFAEPLSELTKWQNSIKNSIDSFREESVKNQSQQIEQNQIAVKNVIDVISDFPVKVFDAFSEVLGNIIIYLDNIATAASAGAMVLTEFPLDIVEWIHQGVATALELNPLEVTVPEINPDVEIVMPPLEFPILTDILSILQQILQSIQQFFSIDLVAIEQCMMKNIGLLEDKLPFLPALRLFDLFSFEDTYDYPIIKIKVPHILSQFFDQEYFILFNGKDYSDYFVFFRGLLAGLFWITYAYVIVCKFRVRFNMDS